MATLKVVSTFQELDSQKSDTAPPKVEYALKELGFAENCARLLNVACFCKVVFGYPGSRSL